MDISGGKMCLFYHQPSHANHIIERGWRGSLNTFLVSALNTKWIKKIFFSEMLQKQHVLLLFQKWHLSSNEAECTVGVRGQWQGQKNKRAGGQVGWGISRTVQTGGGHCVYKLTRRNKEGTWDQEGNQDRHVQTWLSSLLSNILQNGPNLRPPSPWEKMVGGEGRGGFSVEPGL